MRIEVNITKTRFFVLVGVILVLGLVVYVNAVAVDTKVFHGVNQVDWDQEIPGSIKVKGLITVNGQKVLSADDNAVRIGDLTSGDGLRNLILKAGDADRVIVSTGGDVGIGTLTPGSYGGKGSKLDVAGYAAVNDIWLKDKGRWASYQQACSLSCSQRNGACLSGTIVTGDVWVADHYENICCKIVCS